ncbi:hypothetical protein Glove_83g53 [Diversispora epigaea]|uniref:Uncharacterized protein n=1 Tax=Diversispora epigaea TaxID=1348612 RepID=A0A397J8F7_9GLOM|nr:hypothetical protein Glove_83g54 [Diversispora epigaea]RHZ84331.1 hypothetical protein Glove_83g52 [Diversispora epigaea]RHZ84332.1 hypothetical protein Glove_83g53 [Diversispora epigaea]
MAGSHWYETLLRYYNIKVDNKKTWVPLLPGYTIYTTFGNNIFKLFIKFNNQEQELLFSWVDFGVDENNLSTPIASDSQSDRFQSFVQYFKPQGKISIPNTIGINITSISKMLKTCVYKKYPGLYPELLIFPKAKEEMEKIIETVKKKSKRLKLELQSTSNGEMVREGIHMTNDAQSVSLENFYVVLSEYKQVKKQLYNANRQIKRLKIQRDRYIDDDENENNNNDEEELLLKTMQDMKKKAELGLTLLITGFSIKIIIVCQVCKTIKEFSNELTNMNFNTCIANAGLTGGPIRSAHT